MIEIAIYPRLVSSFDTSNKLSIPLYCMPVKGARLNDRLDLVSLNPCLTKMVEGRNKIRVDGIEGQALEGCMSKHVDVFAHSHQMSIEGAQRLKFIQQQTVLLCLAQVLLREEKEPRRGGLNFVSIALPVKYGNMTWHCKENHGGIDILVLPATSAPEVCLHLFAFGIAKQVLEIFYLSTQVLLYLLIVVVTKGGKIVCFA
nr:hypothetical protein [Tanacetum cinerariifolium]